MDRINVPPSSDVFYDVPLSPIPETSSEIDATLEMPENPSTRSLFDPLEENEEDFHDNDETQSLASSPEFDSNSNLIRITRSRSGAIPKLASSGEVPKNTYKTTKTENLETATKETQVVPKMLARTRKPKTSADSDLKENKPPKGRKKQTTAASKDCNDCEPPNAPKKTKKSLSDSQPQPEAAAVKRRLSIESGSDYNPSSSSDHTAHETSRIFSDPIGAFQFGSVADSLDSTKFGEDFAVGENNHSSFSEAPSEASNPNAGVKIEVPRSGTSVALVLRPEMFQEGQTIGIKVTGGQVSVSSSLEQVSPKKPVKKTTRKMKNNQGKKLTDRKAADKKNCCPSDSYSSCETSCSCRSTSCSCSDCWSGSSSDDDCRGRRRSSRSGRSRNRRSRR